VYIAQGRHKGGKERTSLKEKMSGKNNHDVVTHLRLITSEDWKKTQTNALQFIYVSHVLLGEELKWGYCGHKHCLISGQRRLVAG